MITHWPAPAKLNLFLYVTGRRADGYHELQTLFQFLDYGDTLSIIPDNSGEIKLQTPIKGVSQDQNLMTRAARLLKQQAILSGRLDQRAGVTLSIDKHLPIGGGLGGGSSNAATVLVALNHLWQTEYLPGQLAAMGLTLGADVPVFVNGHAAFAEGIGEKLQPVTPPEKWYLIAHPGVTISTAQIFRHPDLKRGTAKRSYSQILLSPFSNDCETVVRKAYSEVEQLVSRLLIYAPSRLTGTGSCVFAEFDTESAARWVLELTPNALRGFVAHGVNVSPLYRTLSGF